MSVRRFQAGDRIRLLKPTICGWRGESTVIEDQGPDDPVVDFLKDSPGAGSIPGYAHWSDLSLLKAANNGGKQGA
jgi:hypothetical protein